MCPSSVVWVPIFVKLRADIFGMEFKLIIVSFIFMIIFHVAWTKLLVSTTTVMSDVWNTVHIQHKSYTLTAMFI